MACKTLNNFIVCIIYFAVGIGYCTAETEIPDKTWLGMQNEENNGTQAETIALMINTPELEQLTSGENGTSIIPLTNSHQPAVFSTNLPTPLNPSTKDVRFKGPQGPRITTPKPSVVVSEEDKKVRKDWGGNCTAYHWEICSNQTVFGKDVFDPETKQKIASQLSCEDPDQFPPVCLFNGWTVTRCHLLCMTKECNKDIKIHYDKYVSKDGFC